MFLGDSFVRRDRARNRQRCGDDGGQWFLWMEPRDRTTRAGVTLVV